MLASPAVNPQVRDSFKKAIMAIGEDDESYDILAELNSEGFVEVDMAAYEGLADLLTRLRY